MARPVHTIDLYRGAHAYLTKFNGVREMVTSLHREIRARIDQVEL